MREEIDILDEEIARLVIKRRQKSQSVQRAKALAGQPLVDLARESQVLCTYKLLLGPAPGVHLAHAVLDYCKTSQVH